ncbi:MAG: LamG-like jellyroll fold domain-containing protein, partial [Verrucomicrobiota bacterium]
VPGMELWLNASTIGSNDNDVVDFWPDDSGNNNPIDNLVGAGSDPRYLVNGLNGLPVVRYDGDDFHHTSRNFNNLGAHTIFSVARYTDPLGGLASQRIITSRGGNWLFGFWSNGDERWFAEGWIHQTGNNNTNWHLHAGTITDDADPLAAFWKDGSLLTTNDPGSGPPHAPQQLALGAWNANTTEASEAEVAEVIIFNRVLNPSELEQVGGYLESKYDLGTTYVGTPAIRLDNLIASQVSSTSAVLRADFSGVQSVFHVSLLWGTVDGGTNIMAWPNRVPFGIFTNLASTTFTHAVSGLASNTTHYFTFLMTNCAAVTWGQPPRQFETQGEQPLAIDHGSGPQPNVGGARLNGELTAGGAADVTIFFGTADGLASTSMWDTAIDLDDVLEGPFEQGVSGLLFGVEYFYRSYATNPFGLAWTPTTERFTPLPPRLPAIEHETATAVFTTSAVLHASLFATQAIYDVLLYYGLNDGGTNAVLWSNVITVGSFSNRNMSLDLPLTGLSADTLYYYAFRATNRFADSWGEPSSTFETAAEPDSFAYQSKIAFCGYDRPTALTNFPAPVMLGSNITGFAYDQFALSGGGDLRFFLAGQNLQLNHEIETWNTSGLSRVWVQVPDLADSNLCIVAAWGNASITSSPAFSSDGSTWNDYIGVWHLEDDGGSGVFPDSARNHDAMDDGASDTISTNLPSGTAQFFNGVADRLIVPDQPDLRLAGNFSASAWFRADAFQGDWVRVVGKGNPSLRNFGLWYNPNGTALFQLYGPIGNYNAQIAGQVFTDQWYHIMGVRDGGEIRLYLNGVRVGVGVGVGAVHVSADSLMMGYGQIHQHHNGVVDTVRIADAVRSDDWVHTAWYSVASNAAFLCYGDVQNVAGGIDLVLTKSVSTNNLLLGSNLIYTLDILNSSSVGVSGVVVTDTMPSEVIVQASVPVASETNGNRYGFNLGTLSAGGMTSIVITVGVTSAIPATITNVATLVSTNTETDLGNNMDAAVTVLPDSDGDGVANPIDPDDDNDGFSDEAEVIAATDPFDPASFFWVRISNTLDQAVRRLVFPTALGRNYRIQSSSNLYTGPWLDRITGIPGSGSLTNIPDTNALRRIYYRIGVETP